MKEKKNEMNFSRLWLAQVIAENAYYFVRNSQSFDNAVKITKISDIRKYYYSNSIQSVIECGYKQRNILS